MRVFMTGGTGYIGSAVAAALRRGGHDVTALARPSADPRPLLDLGVAIVAGDLASLPSLVETIAARAPESRSRCAWSSTVLVVEAGTGTARIA